jgi:hypothetical protein
MKRASTSKWGVWLARSTVFAVAIFVMGSALCWRGHLSGGDWVAMAGIVHSMVVARAIADDYHSRKTQVDTTVNTTVVNNPALSDPSNPNYSHQGS